ncbi:MAG: hypothetical protein K2M95_06960, partial [Clostridiales bacterium]|nr:hypothetical protein [Clostridiales bacterium]
MQRYEAENIALSAAMICAADGTPPARAMVSAGTAFLTGKMNADAFAKKCVDNSLYANAVTLLSAASSDDCSVEGLCALHKTLFAAKPDAGEIRASALERTGGAHADPRILRGSLKNVLTKLSQLPAAPQIAKADFAALLSGYDRELIILSPFAYGNAAVRRVFLSRFCRAHGFRLSFASANKSELTAAEDAAFMGDDPQPLFSLLVKCLNYGQEERKADDRKKQPALPSARKKERIAKNTPPDPIVKSGV